MNQLTILSNTVVTMSSREVAALCEKRHDHVLRDIENLNATYTQMGFPKVGEGYFSEIGAKTGSIVGLRKEKPLARTRGKLRFFSKEF